MRQEPAGTASYAGRQGKAMRKPIKEFEMTSIINQEVEINSFVFSKKDFKGVPRSITVGDHKYSFVDSGLRYLVKQGQHLVNLFDMTDGQSTFRLRNEDNHWTLVSIKSDGGLEWLV